MCLRQPTADPLRYAELQTIRRSGTETAMPRHIRSVTARRPRRIARRPVAGAPPPPAAEQPVTDAPPSPAAQPPPPDAPPAGPAVASSIAAPEHKLLEDLRLAFQATPEIPETPERTRERYVWAIESLANYLEDIGA